MELCRPSAAKMQPAAGCPSVHMVLDQPPPGRGVNGDENGNIAMTSAAPTIKLAATSDRRANAPRRRVRESATASSGVRRRYATTWTVIAKNQRTNVTLCQVTH